EHASQCINGTSGSKDTNGIKIIGNVNSNGIHSIDSIGNIDCVYNIDSVMGSDTSIGGICNGIDSGSNINGIGIGDNGPNRVLGTVGRFITALRFQSYDRELNCGLILSSLASSYNNTSEMPL
ncbi:hypothetical protein BGX31_004565, partial [Mortierella sp. GBA43]